jgi:hypothetical protein
MRSRAIPRTSGRRAWRAGRAAGQPWAAEASRLRRTRARPGVTAPGKRIQRPRVAARWRHPVAVRATDAAALVMIARVVMGDQGPTAGRRRERLARKLIADRHRAAQAGGPRENAGRGEQRAARICPHQASSAGGHMEIRLILRRRPVMGQAAGRRQQHRVITVCASGVPGHAARRRPTGGACAAR